MTTLLNADGWYAAVEGWSYPSDEHSQAPEEDQGTLRYVRVVAWERGEDETGEPRMFAWLAAQPIVRSDKFSQTTTRYFIQSYTDNPPDGFRSITFG